MSIIQKHANIILHGGLLRMAHPGLNFTTVNIALARSNAWLNGTVFLDKIPYYRLQPTQDNYIEIKKNVNELYYLMVNEKIIYETYNVFGYTIKLKLNNTVTMNQDYFIKYY